MKRFFVLLVSLSIACSTLAQGYNAERTAMTNFLVRMYENAPFEGVRAVDDYDNQYLISVLTLDKSKYSNESDMFRVAGVKASSLASRFFNGSTITSDLIIHISERSDGTSDTEIIENINEHSVGYVKALELLTNFDVGNNKMAFIYFTQIVQ